LHHGGLVREGGGVGVRCREDASLKVQKQDMPGVKSSADRDPFEDAMTELRHMKMKIGDAEFEADVAEDRVKPMYDQFLVMLEHRDHPAVRANGADAPPKTHDQASLEQIFEIRPDGTVVLKLLPKGPDKEADAMLLLLYGFYLLKNEECVLATHLFRAAEQSGVSLRRPANEYVRNGRFVVRNGQRKGSNYALNSQGLAMAQEIAAQLMG
jgi:hypothetical protein